MLKDFRFEIKRETTDDETIQSLFSRGEVLDALKACHRTNRDPGMFAPALEEGIAKMFRSERSNEILSLIHKYKIPCRYDVPTLLRTLIHKKDYPGFLKQAYRFGVYHGFEDEIALGIGWLRQRNQSDSADAYVRKFAELAGNDQHR